MDGPDNMGDSMNWGGVWVAAQRVRLGTATEMAEGANASKMGKE
jgi:hypothetical protein